MTMIGVMRGWFGEKYITRTLFLIALIVHVAIFYTMMWLYGPCSFFLSNDCSVNGNDTQHYVVIAYNITHGHGYSRFVDPPYESDGLRTPLLPLYFAPFTYFGGLGIIWLAILFLNILLSLAPVVIYKFSRFFLAHKFAVIAGLGMALEPLYVYRSQIAEPDALFVLIFAATLFLLMRLWREGKTRDAILCGILLGLSILAKPSGEYVSIILIGFEFIYIVFFQRFAFSTIKYPIIMFCLAALIVSPWVIRNKIVFGTAQISSIQGYGLYEYFTRDIQLPNEQIPAYIQNASREPSRDLSFQNYFTSVSAARIKAHPGTYFKELVVGMVRSLFVSDISDIYYYGQAGLLPFPYNPEAHESIHAFVLRADFLGALKASLHTVPKLLWMFLLLCVYIAAVAGWFRAWRQDRHIFLMFTLFFVVYAYLLVTSGSYVDAKYRLPILIPTFIVALYGLQWAMDRGFLRTPLK
jgi:4-amino-4-deoxy-L-arabinose transferase-like glycosyltransferase